MPNSKTKRCQTLKSKSAYMQQALFREAEFSVFRGDLPAVLSGIICVTLSATQILHVTETSNIDDLVTQNIIALRYPSCILDVTQCAAYLRIYYSAAILLLSQPLSRFASGVPCHAPTLPHRETVMRQDICSRLPRYSSARWPVWSCRHCRRVAWLVLTNHRLTAVSGSTLVSPVFVFSFEINSQILFQ